LGFFDERVRADVMGSTLAVKHTDFLAELGTFSGVGALVGLFVQFIEAAETVVTGVARECVGFGERRC
jgi:hypothetical protein